MRELVWLCLIAACGSSSPSRPDGGGRDGGSGDAPAPTRSGEVTITQGYDGAGNAGQAHAGFVMGADPTGTVIGTDGPCTAYTPTATSAATLDAGSIAVTGTLSPVTLTASGSPAQYQATAAVPYPLFSAGAAISIAGAGGADIPTFNGTVTAPADLAGFTRPTSLSRAGYTATWTAGSGPSFWVLLLGLDSAFTPTQIICRVPDSGSFAIPASTFALIPAGDTMGGLAVMRVAHTTVTSATASVALNVTTMDGTTFIPLTQ